jgi:hypothetical protein
VVILTKTTAGMKPIVSKFKKQETHFKKLLKQKHIKISRTQSDLHTKRESLKNCKPVKIIHPKPLLNPVSFNLRLIFVNKTLLDCL